jgi:membrane-bound serine protease (ClpP class)
VLNLDVAGGLDASVSRLQRSLGSSSVPVLSYLPAGSQVDAAALRVAGASSLRAAAPGVALGQAAPPDLVVAADLSGLLRGVDGRTLPTSAGEQTLSTAAGRGETVEMEPFEVIAHRLFDPTTAYLLFVLGLYAVFVEASHPGALVPGLTGLVSLILASFAFSVLSVNVVGVLLIMLAVGLMFIDVKALGHGGLTLLGVGCLVVGSLVLYAHWGGASPLLPEVAIAAPVLIGVAASGLLLGLGLMRVAASVRGLPSVAGAEPVVGARGVSRSALEPEGVVHVNGQLWSARLRSGRLEPGQPIRVRARHGLILEVEPVAHVGAATNKGAMR